MHRRIALAALPLALCAVLGAGTPALAQVGPPGTLVTNLTGAKEVPGPGDADGRGTSGVLPRPGASQVCIYIRYSGIDFPTGAHIHEAPADASGPIVVDFTSFIATSPAGVVRGCTTTTPELARDIAQTPGDYYVNVHNPAFPAGAIRGQLRAQPAPIGS